MKPKPLRVAMLAYPDTQILDITGPLASRAGMSPRNFARVFAREIGVTPARFVETARVQAARRLLEESNAGLKEISAATGLGTPESLRRSFIRRVGIPPHSYRERFHRHEETS